MAKRQAIVNRGTDVVALLVADVYEAAGLLRRTGESIAAAEGQTQARWQLLSVISECARTVPQAARRLGLSRQAVQRVADDVVSAGLATFVPNPEHRTSPLVQITPTGCSVLRKITERAEVFHRELDLPFCESDIETAHQVLRALIERARSTDSDSPS